MSEPARKTDISSYDQDFYAWSRQQHTILKSKRTAGLDWENLAEEINSLGGSERSEIRSRLVVVLQHLLKWQYQPSARKGGWMASLVEARDQIGERLNESPSLKSYPDTVLDKQYKIARLRAADETGLNIGVFPAKCPYKVVEILDEDFYPGEELI